MRKVVVTGLVAVSSLGNSFYESWTAAQRGLSGIDSLTRFDVHHVKWRVAGELKGFDAGLYLSQKEITHLDPFVQYAVAASFMAAEDAGLIQHLIQQKSGVRSQGAGVKESKRRSLNSELSSAGAIIGSSRGGISTIESSLSGSNCSKSSNRLRLSPYLMPSTSINMASSYVAQKLGIKGHCLGISNACSSGANAIGEAYRLIKSGYEGPVFAG